MIVRQKNISNLILLHLTTKTKSNEESQHVYIVVSRGKSPIREQFSSPMECVECLECVTSLVTEVTQRVFCFEAYM